MPYDDMSIPVDSKTSRLPAGKDPGSFRVSPIYYSFSVPVECIKNLCILAPYGGTVEFISFTKVFSHESDSPPERPDVFADFLVFRVICVETNFPVFSPAPHPWLFLFIDYSA